MTRPICRTHSTERASFNPMPNHQDEKGPDEVIHKLGGCGRFQLRIAVIIHMMSIVAVWSMYSMVFVTASTEWRCKDGSRLSTDMNSTLDVNNKTFGQVCLTQNGSSCSEFEFAASDIHTIVTEVMLLFSSLYFKCRTL